MQLYTSNVLFVIQQVSFDTLQIGVKMRNLSVKHKSLSQKRGVKCSKDIAFTESVLMKQCVSENFHLIILFYILI